MNILSNLEEGMTYEVLVSTYDADDHMNVGVFGVRYGDNNFILNIFPNRTLLNIKNTGKLTIHFVQDVLVFTEALLGQMDEETLMGSVSYSIDCNVSHMESANIQDDYGENISVKIIAEVIKIIKVNEKIPTINRATNHIIELLVSYSRYQFMDMDARINFNKKLESTEKIIQKTGNNNHRKAIEKIKKEIEKNTIQN